MNRYEVRLTHPSPAERLVVTHTFADSYELALIRVCDLMEAAPEVWDGWTATIDEDPTD